MYLRRLTNNRGENSVRGYSLKEITNDTILLRPIKLKNNILTYYEYVSYSLHVYNLGTYRIMNEMDK